MLIVPFRAVQLTQDHPADAITERHVEETHGNLLADRKERLAGNEDDRARKLTGSNRKLPKSANDRLTYWQTGE